MSQAWVFAAILLLAGAPAPDAASAAEGEYPGCTLEEARAVCAWTVTTITPEAIATGSAQEFEIPAFATTHATFRVAYRAAAGAPSYGVYGWSANVIERDAESRTVASFSHGSGKTSQTSLFRDRTYYAIFPASPSREYVLQFSGSDYGEYAIEYEAILPPDGVVPERPAASLEKPHLMGASSGSEPAGLDILAAWMTDDRIGDGAFEARIAVVNLSDRATASAPLPAGELLWIYDFTIGAWPYRVWIEMDPGSEEISLCELFVIDDEVAGSTSSIASIWCELDTDRSILVAHIPEAALGNPAAGAPFSDMVARTIARDTSVGGFIGFTTRDNDPQKIDRVDSQRFGFALGGPAVWDELNGCAFCVAPPRWAEAPFAEQHVGNTLQAIAIVFAVGAFLLGLVILRRRRARVKALFDEVDAVVRAHPVDTRAGLLALGILESDLDERYRAGKLHENEYQLASQRIATAATRLSLRRDLGLDDGVPGDEPLARGVRR